MLADKKHVPPKEKRTHATNENPGVPPYVSPGVTVEEWRAYQSEYNRLYIQPGWEFQSAFRKSALVAAMNSGLPIPPLLALEFKDFIEHRGYVPTVG